nr:MAG TPA: hypothetical protein [Caudoviricetes sp.]
MPFLCFDSRYTLINWEIQPILCLARYCLTALPVKSSTVFTRFILGNSVVYRVLSYLTSYN